MKIIYDDIIFNLQKKGGVSRYWKELSSRVSRLRTVEHVVSSSLFKLIFNKPPFLVESNKEYVFHSSYYYCYSAKNIKSVLTVHDFMPEKYWSGFPLYRHKIMKHIALRRCSYLVFINSHLRDEFLHFYPKFSDIPYQVIKHGNTFAMEEFKISHSNYFSYVGSLGVAKNFKFILNYLRHNKSITVKCVGFSRDEFYEYCHENGFRPDEFDNLIVLGVVSDENLASLVRGSVALLIPSIDEGFGLPVVEAVSLGVPVIASNIPSFKELLPSDYLLSLDDMDKSFKLIDEFILDQKFRESVFYNQKHKVSSLSWDGSAAKYIDVYDSMWQQK